MLSSASDQVLEFPLDNAESAHAHLGNFPTTLQQQSFLSSSSKTAIKIRAATALRFLFASFTLSLRTGGK